MRLPAPSGNDTDPAIPGGGTRRGHRISGAGKRWLRAFCCERAAAGPDAAPRGRATGPREWPEPGELPVRGGTYPEVMARITGSWLSGPDAESGEPAAGEYPGEQFGFPKEGPGSLSGMGRRVAAIFLDWMIAVGISVLIVRGVNANLPLLIWFVIGIAAVTLFGFTPGQYFLKLRVARIEGPIAVGFVRALARQVLLIFVVPALFTDGDGRGMHDRATGTALVRSR